MELIVMIAVAIGAIYLFLKIIKKIVKFGIFIIIPIFISNIYEMNYISSVCLLFFTIYIVKSLYKNLRKISYYLSLSKTSYECEGLGKLAVLLLELNCFLFIMIVYANFLFYLVENSIGLNTIDSVIKVLYVLVSVKVIKFLSYRFVLNDSKLKIIKS